ncbi:hypothetical protein CLF_106141 [Clonorchis sinensis]|uniref:DUF5641 domain-containing protein n=1 Tax=Clonorchis sinensis TaxID=79923 RepID=G7YPQ1_CLOSI|nr:hypothetical protein CLF_106141 [Clonorchis sinensis]
MKTARNALGGKLQLLDEFDCEMEIAGHRDCGIVYLAACEPNLLDIDWIDRLHLSTLPIENLCSLTPTGEKPAFRSGNRVLVRDYPPGSRRWTVGVVLKRIARHSLVPKPSSVSQHWIKVRQPSFNMQPVTAMYRSQCESALDQ